MIVLSISVSMAVGLVTQMMKCFSVRVSYVKLTAAKGSIENKDLDCIHGIRVISSFWILLSHTYLGDPGLYGMIYYHRYDYY